MQWPLYGSRRLCESLRAEGVQVNRKHMQRLMRLMALESVARNPTRASSHPEHPVYPYLLRDLAISQPNQVRATDIPYIPMAHGFAYLLAIIDWYSRRVLAWRLSNTLETTFCLEALQEALARFPKPTIFNTDQGFTAQAFTSVLRGAAITISMDGKARCMEDAVELDVIDRGIGIAPDSIKELFDRYYRAAAGKANASGLGLGL